VPGPRGANVFGRGRGGGEAAGSAGGALQVASRCRLWNIGEEPQGGVWCHAGGHSVKLASRCGRSSSTPLLAGDLRVRTLAAAAGDAEAAGVHVRGRRLAARVRAGQSVPSWVAQHRDAAAEGTDDGFLARLGCYLAPPLLCLAQRRDTALGGDCADAARCTGDVARATSRASVGLHVELVWQGGLPVVCPRLAPGLRCRPGRGRATAVFTGGTGPKRKVGSHLHGNGSGWPQVVAAQLLHGLGRRCGAEPRSRPPTSVTCGGARPDVWKVVGGRCVVSADFVRVGMAARCRANPKRAPRVGASAPMGVSRGSVREDHGVHGRFLLAFVAAQQLLHLGGVRAFQPRRQRTAIGGSRQEIRGGRPSLAEALRRGHDAPRPLLPPRMAGGAAPDGRCCVRGQAARDAPPADRQGRRLFAAIV